VLTVLAIVVWLLLAAATASIAEDKGHQGARRHDCSRQHPPSRSPGSPTTPASASARPRSSWVLSSTSATPGRTQTAAGRSPTRAPWPSGA